MFTFTFVYVLSCVRVRVFFSPSVQYAMWRQNRKQTHDTKKKWMWCGHKSTWSTSGVLCVIPVSEFLLMRSKCMLCVCTFVLLCVSSTIFIFLLKFLTAKKIGVFCLLYSIQLVIPSHSNDFIAFYRASRYTHSLALFVTVSALHSCCDCNLTIDHPRAFTSSSTSTLSFSASILFLVSISLTNLNYGIRWHIKQYIKIGHCEKLKIVGKKSQQQYCSLVCTNDKKTINSSWYHEFTAQKLPTQRTKTIMTFFLS